jgi:hypothetical protein
MYIAYVYNCTSESPNERDRQIDYYTIHWNQIASTISLYFRPTISIFSTCITTLCTTGNRVFAESNILRWELNLKLSASATISLARVKKIFSAKKKTLGEEFLRREQKKILSAKKFKKITFSSSIFFYHQHALTQRICSNLTQIYVCLLYLKILLHSW